MKDTVNCSSAALGAATECQKCRGSTVGSTYIENWEVEFCLTAEIFIDFELPTLKLYTLEFIREDAFINLQQIDNLKLSFYST